MEECEVFGHWAIRAIAILGGLVVGSVVTGGQVNVD